MTAFCQLVSDHCFIVILTSKVFARHCKSRLVQAAERGSLLTLFSCVPKWQYRILLIWCRLNWHCSDAEGAARGQGGFALAATGRCCSPWGSDRAHCWGISWGILTTSPGRPPVNAFAAPPGFGPKWAHQRLPYGERHCRHSRLSVLLCCCNCCLCFKMSTSQIAIWQCCGIAKTLACLFLCCTSWLRSKMGTSETAIR